MSLEIDVVCRRGDFELSASLRLQEGRVLALLGPNGSGKSTLLAVLAGLLPPTRGTVRWRSTVLSDSDGTPVPAWRRKVGLLSQEPLLLPHLSVLGNVAYGPRSAGASRRAAAETATSWLDRLGVAHLADRPARAISGGQAARVALARVLAAEPQVLALDEPFAALDVEAAPAMRQLLADVVRETRLTTVLVSHDVLDAALIANDVAVLRDGVVVEQGDCQEILTAPQTSFTAALVGVNLVPAGYGGLLPEDPAERPTALRFRAVAVQLTTQPHDRPNTWEATVRWLEPVTGGVRARLSVPDAPDVIADLDPAHVASLRPGTRVWAHVRPQDLRPVRPLSR